jgi:3-isopropylmalate dehydrogenase
MKKHIAVLPGDGIGPEVTTEAVKILKKVAEIFEHQFTFEYGAIGANAIDDFENPLPQATVEKCLKADAVLLGAVGHPKYDQNPSATIRPEQGLLRLRKELQLFANIRPVQIFEALKDISPLKPELLQHVDFVIYRELTGGIYFGEKSYEATTQTAKDVCIYSVSEIERIAHLAFQQAKKRKNKVTLVDKANVLETSRLWRKVTDKVSAQYPDVHYETLYVDNAAMQLILNPKQFDVILTENMFGDILSDEASVIAGSMGLLPSASIGVGNALFEPIHGSYPQAAGKNIANPMAAILSTAMMFEYWNMSAESNAVRMAVDKAIRSGYMTIDIATSRSYKTSQVGDYIASQIPNILHVNHSIQNIYMGKMTII